MKQYILIDAATGKRLHADMQILTSRTAMILVARLAASGITARIETLNSDPVCGLYGREDGFLWGEGEGG